MLSDQVYPACLHATS